MHGRADIFVELGRRLEGFGSDEGSRRAVVRAIGENGWFSRSDIDFAVAAIRDRMLGRDSLDEWLSAYSPPAAFRPLNIGVVCAGNIPLAGFFDLLCVIISGHNLLLKPSSKDSALMHYIAGEIADIDPSVRIGELGNAAPDALVASGSDTTVRLLRSRYGDIPAVFRGTRRSAAILAGDESQSDLEALCRDIFLYSGLGCRSVSHLFVPHGYDFVPLVHAMRSYADINPGYAAAWRQLRALFVMEEVEFIDCGCCALLAGDALSHKLNLIHYSCYGSDADIAQTVSGFASPLQCIVSKGGNPGFGDAHRPGLSDFPDGMDLPELLFRIGADER